VDLLLVLFFFSSRRRHTRSKRDWSSDVCSSDLRKYRAVRLRDLFLPPGIVKTRLPPAFSFEPDEVLAPEAFEEEFMAPLGQYLRSEERRVGKEDRCR